MEVTATYKDLLSSFIVQKEYSVHGGQTVSLPSTQVSVIRVRRVLVYLTVSFHPFSPVKCSLFYSEKIEALPLITFIWQFQSSHSPDCFSLDKKVHQALCWNTDLGTELKTRIGATDQCCKQGQPASVPAIFITPGFRTAMHHCHYKLNLLTINDFVYHYCLGWSFWPVGRVLLVFLSSFTLVEFLNHSFSLLKHF